MNNFETAPWSFGYEQYENILGYPMECSECDLAPHPCSLHEPEEYEKDMERVRLSIEKHKESNS